MFGINILCNGTRPQKVALLLASLTCASPASADNVWQGTADYFSAPAASGVDEAQVGPFDTYDFGAGVSLIVSDPSNPSSFTGYYQTYVAGHQLNGLGINTSQLDTSGGIGFSGVDNGFELTLTSVFFGTYTDPLTGKFNITGGNSSLYFDTNPNYSFLSDTGFDDGTAILSGSITEGKGLIFTFPGGGIGVNQLDLSFSGILGSYDSNVYIPATIDGGEALFSITLNNPVLLTGISSVMGQNASAGVLAAADGSLTLTAVPVPAAVWLLASGLIGLVSMGGRSRA